MACRAPRGATLDPEKYYIEVIMQEKIKLYQEYVETVAKGGFKAFCYDIKLIFQTFYTIVKER